MAENPDEDHSSFTNVKGFVNHDCTEEDVDLNPQEESRPIVSDASASSSTINEANKKTDSSSSTGEKNKKKLSANAKPWNPDDFRRPDDETSSLVVTQPSNQNPNLSLPQVMTPRRELGHSVTQPLQQDPWRNQFPWYRQPIDPQWQWIITKRNVGSRPLLSNPNDFRTMRRLWQLSPYAALWIPRNTSQSPMLYRAFVLGQYRIYVPYRPFPMPPTMYPMTNEGQQRIIMMMLETTCRVGNVTMSLFRRELMHQRVPQTGTQESDVGSSSQYGRDQEQPSENSLSNQENLYQHPMANQENLYQHPMANHENLHQHPMANQENLYQHPMANHENLHQLLMANHENLYQHPMANQENLYQHPMANQENLYQHPMANQENLYQHPMANQENLYQHPMANQENLYQHPMANHENLYQHQMANQENLYQHPMANQENLYQHQMANHWHLYQQPLANQENQYQQPMDIMRMLETHCRLGDGTMPQFRRELIRQRVLQLEHQTEQPTETQEPDTGSSSQYGGDQEQPK